MPKEKELVEGWYARGEKGFEMKAKIDAAVKAKVERSISRFMLKPDEEAEVIFIDDEPFFVWEHNLRIGDRWGNYATCVKEIRTCPICEKGEKSTYTAYLSIIDTREFIRQKDGQKITNRKVLYPAKGATIKRLEDLKKKHGTLVGCVFKIKRYSPNDPNCGTDFEFIKKVKLTGENALPIDYTKVLYPLSADELAALGFGDPVIGRQEDYNVEKSDLGDLEDLL